LQWNGILIYNEDFINISKAESIPKSGSCTLLNPTFISARNGLTDENFSPNKQRDIFIPGTAFTVKKTVNHGREIDKKFWPL
jgi:hypothetical protein